MIPDLTGLAPQPEPEQQEPQAPAPAPVEQPAQVVGAPYPEAPAAPLEPPPEVTPGTTPIADAPTDLEDQIDPQTLAKLREMMAADKPSLSTVLSTISMAFGNPDAANTMIRDREAKSANATALMANLQQQAGQFKHAQRKQDEVERYNRQRQADVDKKIEAQREEEIGVQTSQLLRAYEAHTKGKHSAPRPAQLPNEPNSAYRVRLEEWFTSELPHLQTLERNTLRSAAKADTYKRFFQMGETGGLGPNVAELYAMDLMNQVDEQGPLFTAEEAAAEGRITGTLLAQMANLSTERYRAIMDQAKANMALTESRTKAVANDLSRAIADVTKNPSHQAVVRLNQSLATTNSEMNAALRELEGMQQALADHKIKVFQELIPRGREALATENSLNAQIAARQQAIVQLQADGAEARELLKSYEDILAVDALAPAIYAQAQSKVLTNPRWRGQNPTVILTAIINPGPDPLGVKEFFWSELQAELTYRTGMNTNWLIPAEEVLERYVTRQVFGKLRAEIPEGYDPLSFSEEARFGQRGVEQGMARRAADAQAGQTPPTVAAPSAITEWDLTMQRIREKFFGGGAGRQRE